MRDALRVGHVPEDAAVLEEGRAVVEHQRRAAGQAGDQPVPHHPAQRREIELAVAMLHVAMQLVLDQVLDQRAAGAVHDALGHAGGTRGIHDVQRVVEGQLLEFDLARRVAGGEFGQRDRPRQA